MELKWIKNNNDELVTSILDRQIVITHEPGWKNAGTWIVTISDVPKYKTGVWSLAFDFAQGWADGYLGRQIEEDKNEKWMILEPANEFDKGEPNPIFVDGKWKFDPDKPIWPETEVNVFDQDRMERYDAIAEELGKGCPNPDCKCKKDKK